MSHKYSDNMTTFVFRGRDEVDRTPSKLKICNFDLFMYCLAIVSHVGDMVTDINVAVRYYRTDNVAECLLTLGLMIFPAFVNTLLSMQMHSLDKKNLKAEKVRGARITKWNFLFFVVFQLAPFSRTIDACRYALKSRHAEKKGDSVAQRKYYELMLKEDADVALLKLFDTFLESAPQVILQMANLLKNNEELRVHQCFSIGSSVFFMALTLVTYHRAIRYAQKDKDNIDWKGSTLQVLWHFCVSISRVTSLSVLLFLFPRSMLIACACHVLLMALWIKFVDRQKFCSQTVIHEIAFSLVMGVVLIFTFILTKDVRTRYRHAVYFGICFLENISCGIIWYFFSHEYTKKWSNAWFFYGILGLCAIPFVFGIIFMIVYYAFFHPSVRIKKEKYNANGFCEEWVRCDSFQRSNTTDGDFMDESQVTVDGQNSARSSVQLLHYSNLQYFL